MGPQPGVPCLSCTRRLPAYAAARSLFRYGGEVRAAIVAAKYAGRPFPVRTVSERLGEALRGPWKDLLPDGERTTVVPVPVHPWKYFRRGFNLPSLIGSRLSDALGASFEPLLLLRDRERSPQAGLPLAKRPDNVRGAFRVPNGRIPAGRILLVDDVYTSGATAESCARALKSRGAGPIVVVTVARTVAWPHPGREPL
jgi:predicted amidophosphoribosyltransferase